MYKTFKIKCFFKRVFYLTYRFKRDDLFLDDYKRCDNYETLLREHPQTRIQSELDEKRKRLLIAVTHNDIQQVKALLDSPRLYKVTDRNGENLLQIAIIRNNAAVFDYLLSLEDFPLELVNSDKETALITAVSGGLDDNDYYFAEQLVKKGANLRHMEYLTRTVWYYSIKNPRMIKLLAETGADVNTWHRHFETPLHMACRYSNDEVVSILLFFGADPLTKGHEGLIPFDIAVLQKNRFQQKLLFKYTFDAFSQFKIKWRILLKLARQQSSLFEKFDQLVMDRSTYSMMEQGELEELLQLDSKTLKKVLTKFKNVVRWFLPSCSFHFWWKKEDNILEKIEVLVKCGLEDEVIKCVQNTNTTLLFHFLLKEFDEHTVTAITCYLLSYDLRLTEHDLQDVYEAYGYCELFKIMLHMDVQMEMKRQQMVPSFIYDLTWDFKTCRRKPYCFVNVEHLLYYFSNSEINDFCRMACGDKVSEKINRMPQVPSLVEITRNAFRKHFIHRYKIKTAKQFFSLINGLCINDVYKKIITYEKKIY